MQKNLLLLFGLSITILFLSCQSEPDKKWEQKAESSTPKNKAIETPTTPQIEKNKPISDLIADYDPPNRELWQKPQLVIEKMGDLSNKTIADIGSGSGSFARRLAQYAEKVIAIELDPRFIEYMDSIKRVELSENYQNRFETRLATPTDSKLKNGEADIVVMVNTFVYIEDKAAYLQHLKKRLPDGGKVIIVDFKKKNIPIRNPAQRFRIPLFEVEKELQEAGFQEITSDDRSLDYQYIVMATK